MKTTSFKSIVIWFLKVFAAGIISLAVLSVISYFYSYTGIHITNPTKSTDYTWLPGQKMNNMKEGFSSVKIDINGFNNLEIPNQQIDILLMGSSHMEAYQVNPDENCGFLLNELMTEYFTYNIGISGHTIYRITDNIESALNKYAPSKYVVIETNTVQLDIDLMNEVISGESTPIKSHDSGLLFYLQKIPAFKPLYNQLDNWIKTKSNEEDNDIPQETVITNEYRLILSDFLKITVREANKHGVTPIIFYAPNEHLSKDGMLTFETDEKYFKVYKETCEELGIVFIDMSDSFFELYNNNKTLAHGFSNTAVGVGHLNRYGHSKIAETLTAEIRKMEGR